MTTNVKPSARPVAPHLVGAVRQGSWLPAARTTEERLQRIEIMAERIAGYIRFMCQVGTLNGTSAEAKERAVTAFYERMLLAEGQLGRIQEDLRLG